MTAEIAPVTLPCSATAEAAGLRAYEMSVEKHWRSVGREAVRGSCLIEDDHIRMTDGSRYVVRTFYASDPRFDTAVTFTTPWGTDIGGYNTEIGKELAEHGISSIAVSPERPTLWQACKRLGAVSLAHDAYAHHVILDEITRDGVFDNSKLVNLGYSRGAMVGFGLHAYAPHFNRSITYSDYIDPCLEHAVGSSEVDIARLPAYIAREVTELTHVIENLPPRELGHLLETVCLQPGALLHQAATGKALFSGEAGKLADHLPPDIKAHVILYRNSKFNHAPAWLDRFDRYPGLQVQQTDGYHLDGADPAVRSASIQRIAQVLRLFQDGLNPAELNTQTLSPHLNQHRVRL